MRALSMLLWMGMLLGMTSEAHAFALKTTEDGKPVRWQRDKVELRIDPALEGAFGSRTVQRAAEVASEAWRGLAHVPDVLIANGAPAPYDTEERNNGIYLITDWPFDDAQVAMTITTYTRSGEIVGVDILVNGERSFEMLPEPALGAQQHDLAAVLTHEVGHALGLAHSEDDPDATMAAHIHVGDTHQRTLSEDDEAAIMEAYAAPHITPTAIGGCSVAQGSRSSSSLLGFALSMLAAVLFVRRK